MAKETNRPKLKEIERLGPFCKALLDYGDNRLEIFYGFITKKGYCIGIRCEMADDLGKYDPEITKKMRQGGLEVLASLNR